MAPKRRAPRTAASKPAAPKRSRLAKENDITAAQESEIREAFALFAVRIMEMSDEPNEDEDADAVLGSGRRRRRGKTKAKAEDDEDEGMGVLRREDVRRCLIALNLAPSASELPELFETLDPTSTGFIHFEPFLTYCALLLNRGAASQTSSPDPDHPQNAELNEAYGLFTHHQPGPITLAHLRRIAKELREEVSDDVLKDMILEANGALGEEGVRRGVSRDDFDAVMKRAGVFG